MSKDFLGKGWRFPVLVEAVSGKVLLSEYEQDIQESIRIILTTSKGERVMRPDFGCGIHDFVFASMSITTLSMMESSIREALQQWEPRIEVTGVNAAPDRAEPGRLDIEIKYCVRSTNNEFNLVYPFYLKEN
ncbi:GPW/gp25 family protein [Phosphitispora fastidiosa]|uniref:GPW/gp25 family protein n=1 Tax=Phosphitispora fastidiosa TaxID=2837202 RepID=UPI001E591159|nr:GPW/gp25 family protein [Phosphitispora fastidiosa]MBU7005768.1 phage baseplate assembly protein W [Phosphitispora fastidiosa]